MSLPPPDPIRITYTAWQWTVAWEWPGQATTWRLASAVSDEVRYLKVVTSGHYPTPLDEAERMRWVRPYVPVPAVVDCGTDGRVDWLVTAALGGVDATRHRLVADPARLVAALARGLAAFHDAVPVDACPFDFRVDIALAHARRRAATGIATVADLHPEHDFLTLDAALTELERLRPGAEDLVVCHGDYCFPNVLLDDAAAITGYLDLGELGVADRWWDVAVGALSTTWNVGPGWEDAFYESYGIERDDDRIAFYRLLYDLVS